MTHTLAINGNDAHQAAEPIWRFKVLPFEQADTRRFNRWFGYADFQPLGVFLKARGELSFTLDFDEALNITAQMIVGTYGFNTGGSDGEDPRVYDLRFGHNRVVDPEGGVLWLRVVSSDPAALGAPVEFSSMSFEAIPRLAMFYQGVTRPEDWPAILENSVLTDDRAPVQLVSDKVVITAWRSTALEFADHDPSEVLDEYANILRVENEMGAIGNQPGQEPPSPLRILVSEKEHGSPNASHYRISLPQYGSSLLTAKGVREEWGIWHELGHMQHQISWSANALTENSVNIFSLAVQRALKKYSRAAPYYDQALAFLNDTNPAKKFEDNDEFVRLIMWEQLRITYGEAFFHRLHREARLNGNGDSGQGDAQYRHYFMVTSALAAQEDLTNFFTAWGWHPTSRTKDAIRALRLPTPSPDPSTTYVGAETEILTAQRQSGEIKITGLARPGSRIKTTNNPDAGWYDPEDGIVYAEASGIFIVHTGRLVDGKAVVKSYDPDIGEALFESNHVALSGTAFEQDVLACTTHRESTDH